MRPLVGLAGAAVVAVLCSGCGLAWIPYDETPVPTPVPSTTRPEPTPTPTPDDDAYTGALAPDAGCVRLDAAALAYFEDKGLVGGAITYPRGAMVKANADWWTVAVATQVNPNSDGRTTDNVDPFVFFISTRPAGDDFDRATTRRLAEAGGGEALTRARECLAKVPTPRPTPSPGSPDTYTGKLAKGAKCTTVPAAMLDQLEAVGRVGGAVTYPRGRMVRANRTWWTVAVATEVHPNNSGLTRDNVPATALFVTNDPSYKESSNARIVYFPLQPTRRDTAAARALKCLGAG